MYVGTVYAQSQSGTQIISGFGVFSCASGLFMFPLLYGYLYQALQVRRYHVAYIHKYTCIPIVYTKMYVYIMLHLSLHISFMHSYFPLSMLMEWEIQLN